MEENTVKTKKGSKKNWYILMLVVGIILLIIFIIWLLMKGDVKTTGEYPDNETPETLKCIGKNMPYKFFSKDTPSNTEIKINAIFTRGKIDSIALIHRSVYDNKESAELFSNIHEGDMNKKFQSEGIKPYSYGATYSVDDKIAQMSLYANSAELKDDSIKYFMLDTLPENLTGYKRGYILQGFTCEVTR